MEFPTNVFNIIYTEFNFNTSLLSSHLTFKHLFVWQILDENVPAEWNWIISQFHLTRKLKRKKNIRFVFCVIEKFKESQKRLFCLSVRLKLRLCSQFLFTQVSLEEHSQEKVKEDNIYIICDIITSNLVKYNGEINNDYDV